MSFACRSIYYIKCTFAPFFKKSIYLLSKYALFPRIRFPQWILFLKKFCFLELKKCYFVVRVCDRLFILFIYLDNYYNLIDSINYLFSRFWIGENIADEYALIMSISGGISVEVLTFRAFRPFNWEQWVINHSHVHRGLSISMIPHSFYRL